MNVTQVLGGTVRLPGAWSRTKGSLWAQQDGAADSKVSMPVAAGVATGLTLLLIGMFGQTHLHRPREIVATVTHVALLQPVVPQAPPLVERPAIKPTAQPVHKDAPRDRVVQPNVPQVASPAAAVAQPVTVQAASPAMAQPLPTAPAVAAPNATGTPTVPSALPAVAKPAAINPVMGMVCPLQVKPDVPRQAIEEGISGTVRARALIQDGKVKEVTILSGPRIFHAAVRAAMLQYKCESRSEAVSAEQSIDFRTED